MPNISSLKLQLLHEYHATPVGGHVGSLRTYARLAHRFYWLGMRQEVIEFVRTCMVCQQAKSPYTHPGRLLQPLPIPHHIWGPRDSLSSMWSLIVYQNWVTLFL